MSVKKEKTGGLEEAKIYMHDREIPQLFESMMTALMFKKPSDHLDFLEQCIAKAKQQPKVKWHTFIDPLPPIPRADNEVKNASEKTFDVPNKEIGITQMYSPLPPINNTLEDKNNFSDDKVIVDVTMETVNDTDDNVFNGSTKESYVDEIQENVLSPNVENEHLKDSGSILEKDIYQKEEERNEETIEIPEFVLDNAEEEVGKCSLSGKSVIFVLGGPGSGKGTQSTKTAEKFSFVHLSAGDLLRAEAAKGGDISEIMKQGQLVPQEITIGLLKQAMLDNHECKGFLIDGFPREIMQGEQFEKEVMSPSLVLNYECSDEILTQRLLSRGKHSGRVDDNEESIKKRLVQFHGKSLPVIEHYGEIISTIDSSRSVDEVFAETCDVIEKRFFTTENLVEILEEVIVPIEEEIIGGGKGQIRHLFKEKFINTTFVFAAGFQGCGKDEQCKKIVENYGYICISINEILEREITSGTERGHMVSDIIESGAIVSQNIIMELLSEAILDSENTDKILIDGFPRNLSESEEFESEIAPAKLLIYFSCPNETLVERLSLQTGESGDPGNNAGIFQKQIESFEAAILPVVDKYKERGIAEEISTEHSIEDIFKDVERVFGQFSDNSNMASELSGKNIIFVLGGPGSGKGTQCVKIVEKYGFCHLSTGDLLREEVKQESERAEKLNAIMRNGELVPQDVILELLKDTMIAKKDCKGFLIDGFPRDVEQGVKFENVIGKCKCILYFECSNECMTERLMNRAKNSGREDDNLDTIKLRLKTFEDKTISVVEKFKDRVKQVNAERSIDEVFNDACVYVDDL